MGGLMDMLRKPGYRVTLVAALLFAAIFVAYTSPMRSGDTWWHLNSGRWIVDNDMLPTVDHFMHTTSPEPSPKKTFVLQSYWLSQSLMYLTYTAAGFHGLVLAKALVFTLMFLMLYRSLRAGGLDRAVSLSVVAPVAVLMHGFDEPRPHILSFLMCITVFYLLESHGRQGGMRRGFWGHALILPGLMVLWTNLHGGAVIGAGMVGIYLMADTLRFIRQGEGRNVREYLLRALWMTGSILSVGLNPGGFDTVLMTFSEMGHSPFVSMIDEYIPTLRYARMTGDNILLGGMVILGALTSLVLLLSWRRLRLEHLILYLIFGYAAYSYYRFSAFFALMSVAVAGIYIEGVLPPKVYLRKVQEWKTQGFALLMAVWVMGLAMGSGNIFKGAIDSSNNPEGAVSTIRSSALPREIYNPYEWGGYLGWRLSPEYKVFVDARAIDLEAQIDYRRAKEGDLNVLSQRGVNTVVFYTLNPKRFGSGVPGVVLGLLRDSSWGLLYYDEISAIFVRRSALERRTMLLGKGLLWDQLEQRLAYWTSVSPSDHRPHAELAAVYAARGMRDKAIQSLMRSIAIRPGNEEAMRVSGRYGIGLGPDRK